MLGLYNVQVDLGIFKEIESGVSAMEVSFWTSKFEEIFEMI